MKSISTRIQSIDAFRGLAALTIVIYHARSMFWVGIVETWKQYGLSANPNAWLGYATFPFSFGGLAVDLFFVLSGYCIHRRGAKNLAINPKSQINLSNFFWRRFWRIYPIYITALCITAVVDAYVRHNFPDLLNPRQDNSLFGFLVSLISLQGLLAPTFGSNGVFWTLALEIHFYLIYPLLYWISRQYGTVKALGLIFISSLCYVVFDSYTGLTDLFIYRGPGGPIFIPYWFTWGMGFYLAEAEAGRVFLPKKFGIITLISVIILAFSCVFKLKYLAVFSAAIVFSGLLWYGINAEKGEYQGNFLVLTIMRIFAFVGIFSYSLYAIHVPVLLIFKSIIAGDGRQFNTLVPTFTATVLALAAGWILYIVVERWAIKISSSKK